MAVWQYSCNLISDCNFSNIIELNKFLDFENDIKLLFGSVLNNDGKFINYGLYEKDVISIVFKGKNILEIYLRLDMRSIDKEKFLKILDFLFKWKLKILNSEDKIVDIEDFKTELSNSNSFKFVNNPIRFFENLEIL